MSKTITLVGGLDVGNGYTKAVVRGPGGVDEIDLPSGVRSTTQSTPAVPVPVDAAPATVLGDFYNDLDASFTSPLVDDTHRKIFGRAGLETQGNRYVEFQLEGDQTKAAQGLSKILVLGVFAAKALRDYVQENGALPTTELVAHVYAGLALPISEYVAHHDGYAHLFVGDKAAGGNQHLVTVKNFAQPVSVRLIFESVHVLPEGASAQFAINEKGEPLLELLLADLRARDPKAIDEDITAADLKGVTDTIGIDVGEGTVNFPVFSVDRASGKGRFNPGASATLGNGYGTALENAIETLDRQTRPLHYPSRKALAEFLQRPASKFKRADYETTHEAVDAQVDDLVADAVNKLLDVIALVGTTTEAAYVYGGGSGPIREKFYPALLKAVDGRFPVFYLDPTYSRHLNREGLYLAAKHGYELAQAERGTKAA